MSSFEIPGVLTRSQKALVRGWWKKVTAAHPKAENFKDMKVPSVDKGVFGIPLTQSLEYAYSSISYIDDHTGSQCYGIIPTIVAKCGSFLKEEGMTTEGIFRLPGSARRLRMLQTIFDTPDTYGSQLDWRGYSVHDAASILRRFINHLPEPVITLDYYYSFKETIDQTFSSEDEKVDAFQTLIEKLPLPHQYLLLYLLDLLALFSTASKYTKMASDCLAAVFVPGILSHPNDRLNPSSYKHSQKVLQFLIEHQESFSMPQSTNLEKITVKTPTKNTGYNRLDESRNSTLTNNGKLSSQGSMTSYDDNDRRASTIYSLATGSFSGTGLDSIVPGEDECTARTTLPQLRRSRTVPGKRIVYGGYEPRQVIYVNRNASQSGKRNLKMENIKDEFV
ncbi:Rho GTPase activation protein [Halteromyces radiatus]|uniref:Rho GTPase activation protein n=1 Tax=Halteromyces radiatus TaxID=101107 RepID=UPI00221F8B8C|nr:Rho GTPase activation protein [Halteromyces radiatus]KAI8093264.1 Rho GTPase activation protein [Halteromyces radiatus]